MERISVRIGKLLSKKRKRKEASIFSLPDSSFFNYRKKGYLNPFVRLQNQFFTFFSTCLLMNDWLYNFDLIWLTRIWISGFSNNFSTFIPLSLWKNIDGKKCAQEAQMKDKGLQGELVIYWRFAKLLFPIFHHIETLLIKLKAFQEAQRKLFLISRLSIVKISSNRRADFLLFFSFEIQILIRH